MEHLNMYKLQPDITPLSYIPLLEACILTYPAISLCSPFYLPLSITTSHSKYKALINVSQLSFCQNIQAMPSTSAYPRPT